jgi:predicted CXXCH cytochrome family protein
MNLEWLLVLAVLGGVCALLLVRASSLSTRWSLVILLGTVITLGAAYVRQSSLEKSRRHGTEVRAVLPREGGPAGYVSSQSCQSCHPGQYETWHRTYHRTMTQYARRETVLGEFNGQSLSLLGRTYRPLHEGDDYWVEMEGPEPGGGTAPAVGAGGETRRVERYRVGLLTGSHKMQVYWIASPHGGNQQTVFPFAWLKDDRRWVPFHQTFLRDPEIAPQAAVWNLNCLQCHVTLGQPRPDARRHVLDTQTAELGIACEACHGPGAEHIVANANPIRRYTAHAAAHGDPTIVNPARLAPRRTSQACGQCHGIKWIAEEWRTTGFSFRPGQDLAPATPIVQPSRLSEQPWLEGPLRKQPTYLQDHYWSDGMVRVSGREYNGLIESPCYRKGDLTCLSCHSLHQSDPDDQLAAGREGNQACLQCHASLAARVSEHTHHAAGSPGSLCYNCHMPYTTYGLLKGIRSHQITSPDIRATVATGRPDACSLCHLDRPIAWAASRLQEWYRVPAPDGFTEEQRTRSAAALWLLRGDAGQRALAAFAMGWGDAQRASGTGWLAPLLAETLTDPYSAVRYVGYRSLRTIPGFEGMDYDFVGSEAARSAAAAQVVARWSARASTGAAASASAAVFLDAPGRLQAGEVARVRAARDNHSMDLQE